MLEEERRNATDEGYTEKCSIFNAQWLVHGCSFHYYTLNYTYASLLYADLTLKNCKWGFLGPAQTSWTWITNGEVLQSAFSFGTPDGSEVWELLTWGLINLPIEPKGSHRNHLEPDVEKQARKRPWDLWKRRGRETVERRDPRYSFQMLFLWPSRGPLYWAFWCT